MSSALETTESNSPARAQGAAAIVIVPGLRDYVADHWQTLLEAKLMRSRTVRSVTPQGRDDLDCGRRVRAIQSALEGIDGNVIIVAHSAGVIALAHWARHHQHAGIVGALLAAPADLETAMPAGYPTRMALLENGWLPMPRTRIRFQTIVAVSDDDPLASPVRVERLAREWGSRCIHVGAVGHLNPAAGFGEWPQAEALITLLER